MFVRCATTLIVPGCREGNVVVLLSGILTVRQLGNVDARYRGQIRIGTEHFGTNRNVTRISEGIRAHESERKCREASARGCRGGGGARERREQAGGERFKRCSTGQAWATRDHHDKSSGQTSIQFISL